MSNETVFFAQMRNYIVYFLVFGLWSSWKDSKYKLLLKAHSIFSITIVFFTYLSAYVFNQFSEAATLSATVSTTLFITILVAHLIITVETFHRCCSQLALVQNLSTVDSMFNTKLSICIPYQREKSEFFVRNIAIVFVVIAIKLFVVVFTLYQNRSMNFFYCIMYSNWIMHLRSIQVLFFVYLVRDRLILIDKEITDVRRTLIMQTNPKHDQQALSLVQQLTFTRILHLKQIYGELYESCELINKTFGWSLLAIMTQSFVDFISNCYSMFTVLEANSIDYSTLAISVALLVPNIVTISTMAFYCSSCFQTVSIPELFRIKLLNFEAFFFFARLVLLRQIFIEFALTKKMSLKMI